jgi:hypothetical protein
VVRTRKRAQPRFIVGRSKVRRALGEIGVATRALTATRAKQREFLTSF